MYDFTHIVKIEFRGLGGNKSNFLFKPPDSGLGQPYINKINVWFQTHTAEIHLAFLELIMGLWAAPNKQNQRMILDTYFFDAIP